MDEDENPVEEGDVAGESEEDGIEKRLSVIGIAESKNYAERVFYKNGKATKEGEPAFTKNEPGVHQYFQCKIGRCKKFFKGPSTTSIIKHLRKEHLKKCPELKEKTNHTPIDRGMFGDAVKLSKPFDEDVFMGKLLKWIVLSDQTFATVDNAEFEDMLEYLKKDVYVKSRTTLLRRLEELYILKKAEMKSLFESVTSKISITCDLWTSGNQLSFFAITGHWLDKNYTYHERLIAFKYVEGEHDGLNLSTEIISVFEDMGIVGKIMCITSDNASNNTKMIEEIEKIYKEKYPREEFTLTWNKIECMAHVVNLAGQALFKNFKQQVDPDTYVENNADAMVSALSRLSFLVRRIRLSPKMKRAMKRVCNEMDTKFLV